VSVEDRLQALEARVRAAEDQLDIIALLNTYGPMVDSGAAHEAASLWVEGGGYNFSGGISGGTTLHAPHELVAMYETEGHMGLVNTGVSHLTATPKISINGDTAEAVGYSFVVLREGERWFIWRAAINHWSLVRTPQGWRIKDRFNRALNGSEDSHTTMRKAAP